MPAQRVEGEFPAVPFFRRARYCTVRQRTHAAYQSVAALVALLPMVAGAACDWNNPGADPARGPTVAVVSRAVASYGFDTQDRALIVSKAQRIANDGFIRVTRDAVESPTGTLAGNLRDMHYGRAGRWCAGPVKRDKWADTDVQPGLVYCGARNCIVVFTVCGNVARIDWSVPVTKPEPDFRFYDKAPNWNGPDVIAQVPEPGTLALCLLALGVMGRRS